MAVQQRARLPSQGRLIVAVLGVAVAQQTSGAWLEGPQAPLGGTSSWMDLESIGQEVLQHRSILLTSVLVGCLSGAMAVATYATLLAWGWLRERLYTVVEVRQHDQLYHWLMDWLAAQQEVSETGARAFAQVHPDFHKVVKVSKIASIRFLPIDDGSLYMFRLHGSPVWISHYLAEGPVTFGKGGRSSGGEHRRVMTIGRGHAVINALFQLAFEHASFRLNGCTEVFVGQPHEQAEHSHWRRLEPRRERPLSTVVASSEPGPEQILADMHAFLSREDWYAKRGVPYRRGYLFHGPPGCGKTTFVTAAAGMLKCPIYVLNLADPYLSDLALLKLVTDAQPRSILLAEDIDAAFHDVLGKPGNSQRDGAHVGQLTFSGVLNALDGVAGQEGKIVVMTTNHPEKLDPALVRPGRVDMRASFHCASRQGVEEIFMNFFQDGALAGEELRKLAKAFSGKCVDGALPIAAVQGHLMQFVDDPKQAAESSPPVADRSAATMVRQFVIPTGAGQAQGGGEEE